MVRARPVKADNFQNVLQEVFRINILSKYTSAKIPVLLIKYYVLETHGGKN
jgi:hypothetical protein